MDKHKYQQIVSFIVSWVNFTGQESVQLNEASAPAIKAFGRRAITPR